MKNTYLASILFIFISVTGFTQNNFDQLIEGSWMLEEINDKPIPQAYESGIIKGISYDSLLILEFVKPRLSIKHKEFEFSPANETIYDYKIKRDTLNRYLLMLSQNKRSKVITKKEFEILKLNNSVLILIEYRYDNYSPFLSRTQLSYKYKKINHSEIVEKDFVGKWYLKQSTMDMFKLDALTLYKDSSIVKIEKHNYCISIELTSGNDKYDYFQESYLCVDCLITDGVYTSPKWFIKPETNEITFYPPFSECKKATYKYLMKNDKLVLTKIQ